MLIKYSIREGIALYIQDLQGMPPKGLPAFPQKELRRFVIIENLDTERVAFKKSPCILWSIVIQHYCIRISVKVLNITILTATIICAMSCSSLNNVERSELIELEKKGYSILLDSVPVQLSLTYLNMTNISHIKIEKKGRNVHIARRNRNLDFYSIANLKTREHYPEKIDMVSVNGLVIDSTLIQNLKFEDGCVQYMRLLTQKDYEGREFDDLPQVKETVGNGILIINTQ